MLEALPKIVPEVVLRNSPETTLRRCNVELVLLAESWAEAMDKPADGLVTVKGAASGTFGRGSILSVHGGA